MYVVYMLMGLTVSEWALFLIINTHYWFFLTYCIGDYIVNGSIFMYLCWRIYHSHLMFLMNYI